MGKAASAALLPRKKRNSQAVKNRDPDIIRYTKQILYAVQSPFLSENFLDILK